MLDDWGYNLQAFPQAKALESPVTFAVLPHLPYSERIAREAYAGGHEVILHMPMEPKKDVPLEKNTLMTSMEEKTLRLKLKSAMESVPYIRAVSNHMGSKFTTDEKRMEVVLSTLQDEGYFYLDSLVTQESVARRLAKSLSLPYLARDIFLDNNREEAYVLEQLERLKELALKKGKAIGIGHDEIVTVRAIKQILPQWKEEGIELVKLSNILEKE